MNIHILQHVSFEGPGYIVDWAAANGHTLTYTLFFEPGAILPEVNTIDALIIMGGPMDVYAEHEFPWLRQEKIFIKDCMLAGKKILGICLGAQLAALCAGAKVNQAAHKEIGWFPVQKTGDTDQLPWFSQLFEGHPVVFHWHGDQFDIPGGGCELLQSAANTRQAFLYNGHVLGLQFHLEVTEASLELMLAHCGHEVIEAQYIQSEPEILEGRKYIPEVNQLMAGVLEQFLG